MSDTRTLARDIGWGIGATFLLFVIMIALAIAWVAFYSYAVEPGHERAFYEAHAGVSSPIVSVLAGGPVFYMVASWLSRRRGDGRAAWIAAAFYLLTDFLIIAGAGTLIGPVTLYFLAGAALKLGGTAIGVRRAGR